MKKLTIKLSLVSILFTCNAFAQGDGSAEFTANRRDEQNLRGSTGRGAIPSNNASDSDVVLKISRANGYYNLTVDGKPCKPVAESALIKDKKKPFPCDDNYSLQGYKYNGWLGGIWAYFEVFQIGSSDELADAEIQIGTWKEPAKVTDGPYDGGK